jgi:hypothetical protein
VGTADGETVEQALGNADKATVGPVHQFLGLLMEQELDQQWVLQMKRQLDKNLGLLMERQFDQQWEPLKEQNWTRTWDC